MARDLLEVSSAASADAPEADSLSEKQRNKRAAIIEAATDLFTNGGYETTTIAHVAKKAGVAVGTVYLYFKNKQEILYAVKYGWEEDLVQLLSQPGLNDIPYQYRFRPVIKGCFEVCAKNAERIQLLGLPPQVIGEIHEANGILKTSPTLIKTIEALIRQAIADGVFRPVDPYIAAVISYGMVSTCLEECFGANGGANQDLYIDMLMDNFSRWIFQPEVTQNF